VSDGCLRADLEGATRPVAAVDPNFDFHVLQCSKRGRALIETDDIELKKLMIMSATIGAMIALMFVASIFLIHLVMKT